jgi:hypothetical protein
LRNAARRVRAVLAAVLPLCACTTPLITADTPKSVHGWWIAPYEWLDECMHLAEGDRVEFAFESSEPVDFNVHYHEGKLVVMPLVHDKTRADAGVFAALQAEDYCLTWEAGGAGALLDYRIRLRPAGT